jgi:hypothetical protein
LQTLYVAHGDLVINIKDYGAKGDGVTNDSAAIASALAAVPASGATVYVPTGVYMVNQTFVVPSNTRIVGAGKNASLIKKSAAVATALFDFSGTGTNARCQRGGMQDIQLNGGDFSGALVRAQYADHLNFDRVWFYQNADPAVVGIELWDSYFTHCEFEFCGNGTSNTGAVVRILGSSTDSSNVVGFNECRWESFPGNALFIGSNGSTLPPYRIYLTDCKMETAFVQTLPFIDMTNDISDFHIRGMYMAADGFNTGFTSSGAPNLINLISGNSCTIRGMHVFINNNTARSVIRCFPGGGNYWIDNVFVNAITSLGASIIEFAGGNPTMRIANVRYKTGTGGAVPVFSGTVPSNTIIDDQPALKATTQTANYTLALSDADTVLEMNTASGATVTVPPASSVGFPIGTVIEILQYGAGQVTIAPGVGVTLRTASSLTTRVQYSSVALRLRATNEWIISGDLT